jgi:hypothetical protein
MKKLGAAPNLNARPLNSDLVLVTEIPDMVVSSLPPLPSSHNFTPPVYGHATCLS